MIHIAVKCDTHKSHWICVGEHYGIMLIGESLYI